MTTIDFAIARPAAAAPTTRLRLTQRGRRLLAAVVALPIAVAVGVGVLSGGAALASRSDSAPAGTFETVTVLAGESLWSIAQQVAPDADPRDVVDDIVRLNALDGAEVRAGQRLAVPTDYSRS
jgi:Tfp pilus assembly protein FimV